MMWTSTDIVKKIFPWVVILIILPYLVFSYTCTLNQIGFFDCYIYGAYTHNYLDLLERYGTTYYGNRIGFIYPARILTGLLGTYLGYYALWYLLFVGLLASFWKISRSYYSMEVSTFIVIMVAFSVWILRAISWNYIDGAAIVYLVIGLHFLIAKYNSKSLPLFLAGFFYALAANCNIFAFFIGGLSFPSWLMLQGTKEFKILFAKIGIILLGFLLGCSILILSFYIEFPGHSLFVSTVGAVQDSLGSSWNNRYFIPLKQIIVDKSSQHVFLPVISLLLSIFGYYSLKRQKLIMNAKLGMALILFLFLTIAAFLILHFVFGGGTIGYFYYTSYGFVATFFVLTWLLGEYSLILSRLILYSCIIFSTVVFWGLWTIRPDLYQFFGIPWWPLLCCSFIFVVASLWQSNFRGPKLILQPLMIFLSIGFTPLLYMYSHHYYIVNFQSKTENLQTLEKEWDTYKGALQLQKWVSTKIPPSSGAIKFWYNEDIRVYNSIQSIFLWGYSRLSEQMKMPELTQELFSLNRLKEFTFLGILGDYNSVQQGKEVLFKEMAKTPNIKMSEFMDEVYTSKTLTYRFVVLKKEYLTGKLLLEPLSNLTIVPNSGASLNKSLDGAFHLITNKKKWQYSAMTPLEIKNKYPEIIVKIKIKVRKGKLGIGVSAKDNSSDFIIEKQISQFDKPVVLDLIVQNRKEIGSLIFRNVLSTTTEAEIYSIQIFEAPVNHVKKEE